MSAHQPRRARSITARRPADRMRPSAEEHLDGARPPVSLNDLMRETLGAPPHATTTELLSQFARDADPPPPPSKVDYGLLEYVSPVDSNLICAICQCPFNQPMQLVCDHTFCNDCLKQCFKNQEGTTRICPACRGPIEILNFKSKTRKSPRYVIQMLDDLLVRCPNSKAGCESHVKRGEIEDHVDKYCDYSVLECSDDECTQGIWRKYSEQGCLHFMTMCEDCGESMMQKDIFEHQEKTCLKRFIRCQHCSDELAKPHLKQHLASICPMVPARCTGQPFGCPFEGTRATVNAHVISCVIATMAPYLSTQKAAFEEQDKANKVLQRKLDLFEGGLTAMQNILYSDNPPTAASSASRAAETSIDTPMTETGAMAVDIPNRHSQQGMSTGTPPFDTPISHLLSLHESLREELSRLENTIAELDSRTTVMILNEGQRSKDEMTHANAAINSMRMQLHWLMSTRLQQNQRQPPGGGGGGPAGEGSSRNTSSGLALDPESGEQPRYEFGRQDTKL